MQGFLSFNQTPYGCFFPQSALTKYIGEPLLHDAADGGNHDQQNQANRQDESSGPTAMSLSSMAGLPTHPAGSHHKSNKRGTRETKDRSQRGNKETNQIAEPALSDQVDGQS